MKFFIDKSGVIFTILENGECNHPAKFQIEPNEIHILDGEGYISDTYAVWDSLHSLAVAIAPKVELDVSKPLNIHDAIEELHGAAEKFRQNWLLGHKENPENYPLEMPPENHGLYAEQFLMSLD